MSGESECAIIIFKFIFDSLTKSVVFLIYGNLVIFSCISSQLLLSVISLISGFRRTF